MPMQPTSIRRPPEGRRCVTAASSLPRNACSRVGGSVKSTVRTFLLNVKFATGGGGGGRAGMAMPLPMAYEFPSGLTLVGAYAMAAQRHMHQFGTTPEQLASISVQTREHAARNPFPRLADASAQTFQLLLAADHDRRRLRVGADRL